MPLTGIAFVGLLIAGFALQGEPPEADSAPVEIAEFYVDNKDSVIVGSVLVGVAALFLIFFGNHLRRAFSAAGEASLSATVLVGASVAAVGFTIDATLSLAIAEAAEDIEPASVQALQAFWDNDFLPVVLGILAFLISAGISVLRTAILPRWLGWAALLLVVVGVTPAAFVSFIGTGVWILVVSVLLARRTPGGDAPVPAQTAG